MDWTGTQRSIVWFILEWKIGFWKLYSTTPKQADKALDLDKDCVPLRSYEVSRASEKLRHWEAFIEMKTLAALTRWIDGWTLVEGALDAVKTFSGR